MCVEYRLADEVRHCMNQTPNTGLLTVCSLVAMFLYVRFRQMNKILDEDTDEEAAHPHHHHHTPEHRPLTLNVQTHHAPHHEAAGPKMQAHTHIALDVRSGVLRPVSDRQLLGFEVAKEIHEVCVRSCS